MNLHAQQADQVCIRRRLCFQPSRLLGLLDDLQDRRVRHAAEFGLNRRRYPNGVELIVQECQSFDAGKVEDDVLLTASIAGVFGHVFMPVMPGNLPLGHDL